MSVGNLQQAAKNNVILLTACAARWMAAPATEIGAFSLSGRYSPKESTPHVEDSNETVTAWADVNLDLAVSGITGARAPLRRRLGNPRAACW